MRNCRHHHLFFPSYISVWSRKVSKYNQRIIPRSVSILFSFIFSAQNIHLKKTHKHKTQQYLSSRMAAVWSRTFRDKPWHVNYYKCRNRKISDTKLNEKCELNLNFTTNFIISIKKILFSVSIDITLFYTTQCLLLIIMTKIFSS